MEKSRWSFQAKVHRFVQIEVEGRVSSYFFLAILYSSQLVLNWSKYGFFSSSVIDFHFELDSLESSGTFASGYCFNSSERMDIENKKYAEEGLLGPCFFNSLRLAIRVWVMDSFLTGGSFCLLFPEAPVEGEEELAPPLLPCFVVSTRSTRL